MKHYDINQWTDFVRGLASGSKAGAMREHLDSGCARCRSTTELLERVVAVARIESEHTPPEYAVRSVQALFSLQRPERRSLLRTLDLSLSFDSGLAPAAVGLRAGGDPDPNDTMRRQIYKSDDFTLDLLLAEPQGARIPRVAGQLTTLAGEPVVCAGAFLVSQGEVAASCFTEEFGNFELDCQREAPLELWLLVGDQERIVLPLETR